MAATDKFTRSWIIENSITICDRYDDGVLTIRGLHYQLVGIGMTNTQRHYKRVVGAMIKARWDGVIEFEKFSDRDRAMVGETEYEETTLEDGIERGKANIRGWMNQYYKNRWENQDYYIEVFIEKKALEGVFEPACNQFDLALGACKGYPSLTFLNESAERFNMADEAGKKCVILYFGDYDPSGEDIPRSIQENLNRFGANVEVDRRALMEDQVIEWGLPPAPTKVGDSRSATWDGLGQVELDAVEPLKLQSLVKEAIEEYFDEDLYDELMETQAEEKEDYIKVLKDYVKTL